MQENLHITVAAVIEQDGRFLLVEESIQGRIVYNQPAGHLEQDETLYQAVIRETLEETTACFNPTEITGIYQWTQPENRQTFIRICFTGEVTGYEKDRPLDKGILRTVWMTENDLLARQAQLRSPLVIQCIRDYQLGRRYPLELIQHIA